MTPEVRAKLAKLSLVVTDFDGVLTDGSVYVDETGCESVRCSRHDGRAVERWREAGIHVVILSREKNLVVSSRARKMGCDVWQGENHKDSAMRALLGGSCAEHAARGTVLYVGDSEDDVEAMSLADLAACPFGARHEALSACFEAVPTRGIVVPVNGGLGVLAWLCDQWRAVREEGQ